MMIHISIYSLVLMILSSVLTVMHSAEPEDPCPSTLANIVADMCTDDSAIEDSVDGSKDVDSVLLRITKHQNNCICHVTLNNTATNYAIYMSKYNVLSNSGPVQSNCGLAVDVEYQETSGTTQSLTSIACTSGTSIRSITLGGSELNFKSRIITGDFDRGYCMQIFRNESINSCIMNNQLENKGGSDGDWIATYGKQHTSVDDCKQYCLQTKICVAVHYEYGNKHCFVYNQTTTIIDKDNTTYFKKHCVDTQKLQIKCDHQDPMTETSQGTTTEDNLSKQSETVTTTISNSPLTNSNTHSTTTETKSTKDNNSDLYVYLGAGAGGLLMILVIVCIIVCLRKRFTQALLQESKNDSTKQFCREDRDSDNDYGGLKDNVLYVSSEPEPNEILEDGNYNTVDLEQTRKVNQDNNLDGNYSTVDGICNTIGSDSSLSKSKPVIKPKPKTSFKSGSVDETIYLSTMDNSNNEYAVVDKGRNSDAVKHISPEHGNDTEYAVVNKVKRSSNNN